MDDFDGDSGTQTGPGTATHVARTLVFDSTNYPSPTAALQAWRAAYAPLFDTNLAASEPEATFRGTLKAYHLGSALLLGTKSVSQQFRRTTATIARSRINHYLVKWLRAGGLDGVGNAASFHARAGDIVVLDLSLPVCGSAQDFDCVGLIVPRALIESGLEWSGSMHGMVIRGDSAAGALLGDHLKSLYACAARLPLDRAQAILQATASLIAGCLGQSSRPRAAVAPHVRATSLGGIQRFVDTNLGLRELKPDLVCDRFGLSRPTLFRMFGPFGGFSHYIRDRRLRRCFDELVSPQHAHRRISEIADNWCFNNEAVFSRAFRRKYEASPREVRQAALGAPHRSDLARWDRSGNMQTWLHDLSEF